MNNENKEEEDKTFQNRCFMVIGLIVALLLWSLIDGGFGSDLSDMTPLERELYEESQQQQHFTPY